MLSHRARKSNRVTVAGHGRGGNMQAIAAEVTLLASRATVVSEKMKGSPTAPPGAPPTHGTTLRPPRAIPKPRPRVASYTAWHPMCRWLARRGLRTGSCTNVATTRVISSIVVLVHGARGKDWEMYTARPCCINSCGCQGRRCRPKSRQASAAHPASHTCRNDVVQNVRATYGIDRHKTFT